MSQITYRSIDGLRCRSILVSLLLMGWPDWAAKIWIRRKPYLRVENLQILAFILDYNQLMQNRKLVECTIFNFSSEPPTFSYLLVRYAINVLRLIYRNTQDLANFNVHSCAFFSACFLLLFHSAAASLLSGSSGFGSDNKLWIERSTDFICSAGDQFFFKISKQIRPKLSK